MKEMWDTRYADSEFVYGKQANEFFKNNLQVLPLGSKVLFAAEGEGRNAVFAAKKGMQVYAVDLSEEGKKKALQLAIANNVKIEYQVGDLLELDYPQHSFDAIVLIFAHFPSSVRSKIHQKLLKLLKLDGVIILEAFSKNHLEVSKNNESSSGPSSIDLLYSVDLLKDDFSSIEFSMAEEVVDDLDEGPFHQGKSSLIRMIGKKR